MRTLFVVLAALLRAWIAAGVPLREISPVVDVAVLPPGF
jgi:hypothetical protein